jgi:hypothetical protein
MLPAICPASSARTGAMPRWGIFSPPARASSRFSRSLPIADRGVVRHSFRRLMQALPQL